MPATPKPAGFTSPTLCTVEQLCPVQEAPVVGPKQKADGCRFAVAM
jgi:hypothetical protein